MLFERYLEHLTIYGENLSLFYIICALSSFLAVWFTWSIQPSSTPPAKENSVQDAINEILADGSDISAGSNVTNDRKALLKSIESSLSSVDKEKEIQTEKQQLLDILMMMKKDEKFKSITIEELKEQLKLYKE